MSWCNRKIQLQDIAVQLVVPHPCQQLGSQETWHPGEDGQQHQHNQQRQQQRRMQAYRQQHLRVGNLHTHACVPAKCLSVHVCLCACVCACRHEQPTNRASVAPGPGEYPARSCLSASGKTIATRLTPSSYRQQQQIPGPAEYEVFDSTIGVAGKLHM